jgi:AbrB family looped-hinge helix DNA binding protein
MTIHYKGVLTLPLVKVKDKFQITIPAEIREEVPLAVGDLLEATVDGQTIVLKPKEVVDRRAAWEKIEQAMGSVEDLAPNPEQSPKEQEEEIARMVKAYRRAHAKRRP